MTREGSPGRGQDRKLQSGVPPATAEPQSCWPVLRAHPKAPCCPALPASLLPPDKGLTSPWGPLSSSHLGHLGQVQL